MSADGSGTRRSGLQLVARVADLLRALEHERGGLTLSELSQAVSLPKSTVHRLVAALEDEGFVTHGRGQIRLGTTIARLGAASHGALRDEVLPYMQRLSQELHETVDLAALDGGEMRFIEQIAAPRRLRAVSAVGDTFPLHCTANGKALLAALPRSHASELLPGRLPTFTKRTITSKRALWEEIEVIAREGVAFDREEHTEGICAVGAVVHDSFGAMAAVSIPMPSQRFYGREQELARLLRETMHEATVDLGGAEA